MLEIYNYSVEDDGYYFVDHLVNRTTASTALQIFLDAALSTDECITITEP